MPSTALWLPLLGLLAQTPASDGAKLLTDAIAAYDAGDDAAARKALELAKKAASTEPKTLARVQLYLGLTCRAQAKDAEQAIAAFRAALILDPELNLPDEQLISPRVREWWTRAGGRLAQAPAPVLPDAPAVKAPAVVTPAATPAPTPVVVEPAPASGAGARPSRVAAVVLAVAAAVGAGVALGLGVSARLDAERATEASLEVQQARALHLDAQGRAVASNGFAIGAGACALGAGVAFALSF